MDWAALKSCSDEKTCGNSGNYIISDPYSKFSNIRNMFTLIFSLLLITYWLWRSYLALSLIKTSIQMEQFYREKLGITMSDLHNYGWEQIIERLIKLHDNGIYRVAIKDKLTEHDIILRIMRKENYLISLINKNILDLRVPWWITPFISQKLFLTKSLEWSLSFCILEYMFNEQFNISTLFLKDVNGLQGRFIMVSMLGIRCIHDKCFVW